MCVLFLNSGRESVKGGPTWVRGSSVLSFPRSAHSDASVLSSVNPVKALHSVLLQAVCPKNLEQLLPLSCIANKVINIRSEYSTPSSLFFFFSRAKWSWMK